MTSAPVVSFFSSKSGVGKTTIVGNLAWLYSDLGLRVIAVDLDPQAYLTAFFLNEDRLEKLWPDEEHDKTIFGCIKPIVNGLGDINSAHLEGISDNLSLIVGDLCLYDFEDELSQTWSDCLKGDEYSFRIHSSFYRVIQDASSRYGADLILIDLGSNLGAINRASLIASDYVVIPLSPDFHSILSLKQSILTLRKWGREWTERLQHKPNADLLLPSGAANPIGYIIQKVNILSGRPIVSHRKWLDAISVAYRSAVSDRENGNFLLASIKNNSLMDIALEVKKPVFHLQVADGAIGSHFKVVRDVYLEFRALALEIAKRINLRFPL